MLKKTDKQREAIKLLASNARHIMTYGGSRSGKTFLLTYAVLMRAAKCPNSKHLIVRKNFAHIKASIWYETLPKLKSIAFPELPWAQNKQDWFIELPNGSQVWIGGLDDKERTEKILGTEYSTVYFNECSQISWPAVNMALTRLAQKNELKKKAFYDCNPPNKKHWTYQVFVKGVDPASGEPKDINQYKHILMNPKDNLQNIDQDYIEMTLASLSHRERQRFEYGEFLDDIEGALWKMEQINQDRVESPPNLNKIVVGVDPAVTSNKDSDETGIVVTGIASTGDLYILDDRSGRYTPSEWARAAVNAYRDWQANYIVAEKNQGGDMVKHTINTEDRNILINLVHASKGKYARAEPIVALYEQHKVHHVGCFPELEDQMCSWVPNISDFSPDRLDAAVWSIAELTQNQRTTRTVII
jgi:phage terminase large subunit-like protein